MVTFEYVGYFNGAEMVQVLNGIAAIVSSNNGFGGLVKAIAIGGFITVMMTALIKLDIKEAAHYVLALAFVNTLMFAPLGRVVVIDKYAATTTPSAVAVDNVPLGVAFAVGELNHIGVFMTDLYETVFSEVDAPKFTTTGMMFGARLYEKLGTLEIDDVNFRRNMGSFVSACVNPELIDYPNKVEPLRKSGRLVEDLLNNGLGILNPARIVSQSYSDIPLDCVTAGQSLSQNFSAATTDNVSNRMLDRIGASLNLVSPRDVGAGNAALRAIVSQKMAIGASYVMNQSLAAKDQIDQAVMANLFTSSQQNAGALSGDTATAISSVLAKRQVEQQYKTMRVIAEEALPRLRSMVEYVCVAIFPAVLLIMVAAGAKALLVLRVYLGILLSINLWPPLYAVVNHLMTLSSTKYKMAAIVQNEGVMSLTNIQAIQAAADSDLAMAGLLTLSIPAIALALVKGGDAALTGAIGGITSPATSAAGSVAANTSSGNFNYGNYGAGNISAANTQLGASRRSASVDAGSASVGFGNVNRTQSQNLDGSSELTVDASGRQSKAPGGFTANTKDSLGSGTSAEVATASARTAQASAALSRSLSNAGSQGLNVQNSNGTSASLDSSVANKISGARDQAFQDATSTLRQSQQATGLTDSDIASISGALKGQGGFDAAGALNNKAKAAEAAAGKVKAGLSAGAGFEGRTSVQLSQQAQALRQAASSQSVTDASRISTGSDGTVTLKVGSGASSQTITGTGRQIQSVAQASQDLSSAVRAEQSARSAQSASASTGYESGSNAFSALVQRNPGLAFQDPQQLQQSAQNALAGEQQARFGNTVPAPNQGVVGAVNDANSAANSAVSGAPQPNGAGRVDGSSIGLTAREQRQAEGAQAGSAGATATPIGRGTALASSLAPVTNQLTGATETPGSVVAEGREAFDAGQGYINGRGSAGNNLRGNAGNIDSGVIGTLNSAAGGGGVSNRAFSNAGRNAVEGVIAPFTDDDTAAKQGVRELGTVTPAQDARPRPQK